MLKLRFALFAVLCSFSLLSVAKFAAQEKSAEEKRDAAALYKKHCAMCHKADGKGYAAMKTPDFTNKEWQASKKDEEMIESVAKGKGTMPASEKKLKSEEIKLLVTDVVRKFAE